MGASIVLKERAQEALKQMSKDESTVLAAVTFGTFDNKRVYHSDRYAHYDVPCHLNSHQSAGWMIWKYFWSGGCSLERALQKFNTTRRHTKTH